MAIAYRRIAGLALVLAGTFSAQLVPLENTANAQSSTAIALAQRWTNDGRDAGRAGKWDEALADFKKAQEIEDSAQLEFYIGVANEHLGSLVEAGVAFGRAISMARVTGNGQVISVAQNELTAVNARTPSVVVTVTGAVKPTGMTIDGAAEPLEGIGAALPVDPGSHTIVVTFPNGNVSKSVSLKEKESQTVSIEAPTGPIPPPPTGNGNGNGTGTTTGTGGTIGTPPPKDTGEQPHEGGGIAKPLGWTLVGVGAASIVTSGIFFGLSFGPLSDNDQLCNGGTTCQAKDKPTIDANVATANSRRLISGIFGGAGAIAAGIGVYLLVTAPSSHATTTTTTGAVLTPWVGPGGGGASLVGRF